MAQILTLQPQRPPRPFLSRLADRLRHGLLTQEILDRLARAGIVIYPYLIVVESASLGTLAPSDAGYGTRPLTARDAAAVSRITLLKTASTTAGAIAARMQQALCLGAFTGRELVGYTWIGFEGLPTPGSGRQWLFEFRPNEACVFDLYVIPAHRGQRLSVVLRDAVSRALEERGCTRVYSVRLAFNRATRRFQARVGAQEAELRVYLHLRLGRLPGIDFRLRRLGPATGAPSVKRIAARRKRAAPSA